MKYKIAYVISAIVLLLLSWYYFIHSGRPVSPNFINAVVAFGATIIIAIAFIIGPIVNFIPRLSSWDMYRKPFGLIGFGLAGLHTLIVFVVMLESTEEAGMSEIAAIGFAAVAFMIFTLMALTSTNKWVTTLGYENWKNLQRTGYIAFVFVLLHVLVLENGVFFGRLTGQIVLILGLAVLLLRALSQIMKMRGKQKIPL
ncbi:MAG: hypothetical protein COV47_02625 [Candidatus Diapherotrites archaeon CG11_big_fil_rev_8_21_14_0_20_37_9]|nr:MAG: hypothetical protein COV47_02625 [Candidatus Diapherotrites archaeon CG11_big_fil_rev_8_21_14_0_20_37_9]